MVYPLFHKIGKLQTGTNAGKTLYQYGGFFWLAQNTPLVGHLYSSVQAFSDSDTIPTELLESEPEPDPVATILDLSDPDLGSDHGDVADYNPLHDGSSNGASLYLVVNVPTGATGTSGRQTLISNYDLAGTLQGVWFMVKDDGDIELRCDIGADSLTVVGGTLTYGQDVVISVHHQYPKPAGETDEFSLFIDGDYIGGSESFAGATADAGGPLYVGAINQDGIASESYVLDSGASIKRLIITSARSSATERSAIHTALAADPYAVI